MRRALAALTLVAAVGAAPLRAASPASEPLVVAGAERFDLPSTTTGRTYRVFVQRPSTPPPAAGWPVVVVTDGNATFAAAAAAERIGELAGRAALIVGVGYPVDTAAAAIRLRNRDLTPPTPLDRIRRNPGAPPPVASDYGGSVGFYHFLVDELRPQVAARYPVDAADQTLYGHSFGGLFTLGVLFAHPEAFRTFVVSSPSIWWNDRAVLAGEAGFAARVAADKVKPRVLVLVGGDEQRQADGPLPPGVMRADMDRIIASTRMVDNARELAERLAAIPGYAAAVRFHAFADENHIAVVSASIADALSFAARR